MEKGNLSINSENILPIIKKWLYSDKDIFIRELVSNASDAITKFKKLVGMGEADAAEGTKYSVKVTVDSDLKMLHFSDNGIGMTADEIKEYINQIAFSGAEAFMTKYKDKLDKDSEIIGHFGLGFYSAFMVADKVEINTLSYQEGAQPAKWSSDGGIEYELGEGDRAERGTTITLYLGEDGKEFAEESTVTSTLKKYCEFMPVDIFFDAIKNEKDADLEADELTDEDIEEITDEEIDEIIDQDIEGVTDEDIDELSDEETDELPDEDTVPSGPTPINDPNPLWLKQPKDCTEDDYKKFYHKVFFDMNEPLFWIHLNMDYPFRLKGILYFPKLKHELETIEGQVKLYNNQVYVADNIKEVIPEFLLLLKGTIDCPDLPLNVSRSFLQNDGYATKMSTYITKKVADKLNQLFKNEKDSFVKFWDDISPFIKYGCLKEQTFYDKIKDILLFKTTSGDYVTLKEYLERNKDKHENKVFYSTNENQQAQYIKLFKDNGMEAVILPTKLDTPYISFLEMQERGTTFKRIDTDITQSLKSEDDSKDKDKNKEQSEKLQTFFRQSLNNEKLIVTLDFLKTESVSGIILESEQARRMKDMQEMFGGMNGMFGSFEETETLALNGNNKLVKMLIENMGDESKKEDTETVALQIYDLALMSHQPLTPEQMTRFIERSNKILEKISE